LMTVAWIEIAAVFFSWLWPSSRVRAVTDPFAGNGFTASVLAASCLFFYNVGMTAAFVEPDYRYHHFMVPLRVLISGFGLILLMRLLRSRWSEAFAPSGLFARGFGAVQSYDAFELAFSRRPILLALTVGLIALALAAWWARFVVVYTG
jgi:hypothetical protein